MKLPFRRPVDDEPAPPPAPIYLVSTAGHPNYGDELITRAWLDFLARTHPDTDVWLDCPHPGRAAHLFAGAHPRLRCTDTLWELALGSPSHDPVEDVERIGRLLRDLGSPRFDPGLLALREVGSAHLLGGGYLNAMWHDNLGLISALAELHRAFGVRVFATGQGLMPADEGHRAWLEAQLEAFELFETRDDESAALVGGEVGLDDAFLALALDRPVFDTEQSPDRMILVQGDLTSWEDAEAEATIHSFTGGRVAGVGLVEAIPPDDARYAAAAEGARFYPFGHLWAKGLPARSGQQWLTSRFHIHLMAAAAGAAGAVLVGREGYYDVKHRSLMSLGTGWKLVPAGADMSEPEHRPTRDETFPARARELATRKLALARRLYR